MGERAPIPKPAMGTTARVLTATTTGPFGATAEDSTSMAAPRHTWRGTPGGTASSTTSKCEQDLHPPMVTHILYMCEFFLFLVRMFEAPAYSNYLFSFWRYRKEVFLLIFFFFFDFSNSDTGTRFFLLLIMSWWL